MATPIEEVREIQKNAEDPEYDNHYWNCAFVVELTVIFVVADFSITNDGNCCFVHDRSKASDNAKYNAKDPKNSHKLGLDFKKLPSDFKASKPDKLIPTDTIMYETAKLIINVLDKIRGFLWVRTEPVTSKLPTVPKSIKMIVTTNHIRARWCLCLPCWCPESAGILSLL